MKVSALVPLAFAAAAYGHTIFQKVSVNGVDQGQLKGVRAPTSDYPIENVNDAEFACNKNIQFKDNTVINIPAGARVGAWWGHVIGGAQYPNDPDHPIARSHKGPTIVYLAKVDNAATANARGLRWFKIAEDGLDTSTGQWGVDRMIANNGWQYFTMPTCVAPGHYLMRVEIIALHGAYATNGAQFYMECAQINVTGSGAYSANHPGITINIYANSVPNNGGRPYSIPGPPVLKCPAGGVNPPVQAPSSPAPGPVAPTTAPAPGGAALYGQCGGNGWTGPTFCSQGTCKTVNEWYSQCVPS
ncbi:endoglucanase II [Coprinopsis cinerea okayama7|uniref:AA9 family lytic polysaccharide monooxygenase n=1 Tax=Coprinopsis cinerea (strain Okayama-7 / 130 / ATCC MYA-4618 / FGSC 9003) TaxID=240176 RepID=A8NKH7_COPC7|nr:endoglucanase II [Coprinopsis cinerea okayama7\|eukprot:XP_001834453.2 endoglucanase II [Coprinopsis cinerea okayama7\